jgi:aspartate/methionine/tyrosine aminotransferase
MATEGLGALRDVPYMGVIYVVAEASKLGYHGDHPDWCNLGQGMPEVGDLPGAPERIARVAIDPRDHAYGPVAGIPELREAVAEMYNRWYRRGLPSRYRAENVAIAAGGRLGLTRAIWSLAAGRLGYFTPDYTAYEDLLGGVPRVHCHHIALEPEDGFAIAPERLGREMAGNGLGALLVSNPCNPTGRVIRDRELSDWLALARAGNVTLLLDEYYSHFVWNGPAPVSAAAAVEDVDRDPVLLFDGLTKNFRYPGWRVGWTIGPRRMIEALTAAGSALDGGASRWEQRAVLPIVEPDRAERETGAMRAAFRPKGELLRARLEKAGLRFASPIEGTFYGWASVEDLPPPLDRGSGFFREALKRQVITVPGEFFDVNPGKTRPGPSRLERFVRFSFGAPAAVVERGLGRIDEMIAAAR